ncbi:hypothetical protein NF700_12830 [Sphingomonadaceae bacterium OTU29MARTA1]|nr:hypothetical protein NF700_12830 [Sphingomonadaceae bacterium OTU29MARTA1]
MSEQHLLINADAIRLIASWLDEAGLEAIEIDDGKGGRMRIVAEARSNGPVMLSTTAVAATTTAQSVIVTSPAFGHLRDAVGLDGTPWMTSKAGVRQGETIGMLEIGTVAVAIPSPCDGIFSQWLAAPGALIGYGEEIAILEPLPRSQA